MNIQRYIDRFGLSFPGEATFRRKKLTILRKVLSGSIYDKLLPYYKEFSQFGDSGTYNLLIRRAPSIQYKLCKIIVDSTVSMLFGENFFPEVRVRKDEEFVSEIEKALNLATEKTDLRLIMIGAAKQGSIGSTAILVRYIENKFLFEILDTVFCAPVYDMRNPSKLLMVKQSLPIKGRVLQEMGENIKWPDDDYFVDREWTETQEIYYKPYREKDTREEGFKRIMDDDKSYTHDIGCVPVVWIKNLTPDQPMEKMPFDGQSTFEAAIDISIEIDYLLSQISRALKYNTDPTMVVKNPSMVTEQQIFKGPGVLLLAEDGDAKLVESSGSSIKTGMEYVEKLRELALESVRGDRSDPHKMNFGHSGIALKMTKSPLTSVVEELRISYGNGLINIYNIILKIISNKTYQVKENIQSLVNSDMQNVYLTLEWPDFYPMSPDDKVKEAQAVKTLTDSGNLSQSTAVRYLARDYNVENVDTEVNEINQDREKFMQTAQPKVTETLNI